MTPPAVAVCAAAPQFHPVRPTVDRAAAIQAAGVALSQSIAKGRQIDGTALRSAMERAFGASDAYGAWVWKDAYEAVEVAQIANLTRQLLETAVVADVELDEVVEGADLARLTADASAWLVLAD
ncbi:MAG: hypothetical protein LCH61_11075, partial [Proteobacteria bacterium]|nr:hypothetical protein [Pseudomonadota bacterium]